MKSMKIPNDPIGNRTRDLPACSAVHLSHSKVHQQITKAQRGSRGIALSVTWAIDGGGGVHAPAALPPGNRRHLLHRRLGGPQGRSRWVRKRILSEF